jgi:hypothetical protein
MSYRSRGSSFSSSHRSRSPPLHQSSPYRYADSGSRHRDRQYDNQRNHYPDGDRNVSYPSRWQHQDQHHRGHFNHQYQNRRGHFYHDQDENRRSFQQCNNSSRDVRPSLNYVKDKSDYQKKYVESREKLLVRHNEEEDERRPRNHRQDKEHQEDLEVSKYSFSSKKRSSRHKAELRRSSRDDDVNEENSNRKKSKEDLPPERPRRHRQPSSTSTCSSSSKDTSRPSISIVSSIVEEIVGKAYEEALIRLQG